MKLINFIRRISFYGFLITVFFLYYETRFFQGTFHTWLMMIGLVFSVPYLIKKYCRGGIRLPFDYCLILGLMLLIVTGYLINFSTALWSNFQAYMLMLLTYVFVKENTTSNTLPFLYSVIKCFLIINGLLIIIQTLTGDYFPARYLAAGDPPLLIVSGVSDGPTKNGMLISFSLSFMFANLLFKRLAFSLIDFVIFLIGVISLFLSASRAGLFSFGAVVFIGGMFAIIQTMRKKDYRLSFSFLIIISFCICGVLYSISQYDLGFELLYEFRDSATGNWGLDVLAYKTSTFFDDSIAERFDTISYFSRLFYESPLHFFSTGYGTGSFESLYGLNIHNSWLELLVTTGIFGFFAFLILVAHVLRKALNREDSLKIVPVIFALVSVMFFMMAHDILRGRIFWLALGIISGFTSLPTQERFNMLNKSFSVR